VKCSYCGRQANWDGANSCRSCAAPKPAEALRPQQEPFFFDYGAPLHPYGLATLNRPYSLQFVQQPLQKSRGFLEVLRGLL
jgi:hypothetical protein